MPDTIIDLGKKVKAKYPGQYDDLPDAEVGRRVKAKFPGQYDDFADVQAPPLPGRPLPPELQQPSPQLADTMLGGLTMGDLSQMPERLTGALAQGLQQPLTNDPKLLAQAANVLGGVPKQSELTPNQQVGAKTAAITAGSMVAAPLVKALTGLMPSTANAGAKFESVMGAAKDVPIDTAAADDIMARAEELRQRGSTLPKVLRDYAKARSTGEPMTYETGRDFASNAGALSAREATATNAKMQAQVNQFAAAMKDANREAAVKVGMGDLYDAAIKEYRQAKTMSDAAQVIKKWGTRAALAATLGAAGKAGYDIYERLNP